MTVIKKKECGALDTDTHTDTDTDSSLYMGNIVNSAYSFCNTDEYYI